MNDRQPEPTGKVALVAGATRGAGRAIAIELGKAGAPLGLEPAFHDLGFQPRVRREHPHGTLTHGLSFLRADR